MHPQTSLPISLQAWMPTQTYRDRKVPQKALGPLHRSGQGLLGRCLADTPASLPLSAAPHHFVGYPGPLLVLQSWRLVYLGNISGWRISGIAGLKISQSLPGRVTSPGFERVGRSQPEKPRVETGELGEVVDIIVGSEGQRDLIKMMMMMMVTRKTLIEGFWSAGHYPKYFTYEN